VSAADTTIRAIRVRLTGPQRREQLLGVALTLFAERGIDGTSVEEIAAAAGVSKPVVYEHFGGKEGLYAAVVEREARRLDDAIQAALAGESGGSRALIERGAVALLDYIDERPTGFRVVSRDSSAGGSYADVMSDVADRVENVLRGPLGRRGFDPDLAMPFSRALVGLVAAAGQAWLETRRPPKAVLATELVNLAWNGLANLEQPPDAAVGPGQAQTSRARS